MSAALPIAGVRVLDAADAHGRFAVAQLAALGATLERAPLDAAALARADVAVVGRAARAWIDRRAEWPHLVWVALTPFGLDGPRADWHGGELVAQAAGGVVWPNGHPGEPPLPLPGAQAMRSAGLHAALGVLLALLARRRDGRGRLVDISLQESATAALEHVAGEWFDRGALATRQGTLHWNGTFRVGRCRDGEVLLSHVGDWTALREWLLADGAAQDLTAPRWNDPDERGRHAVQVFDVLDAWAAGYAVDELVTWAQAVRLPFAAVRAARGLGVEGLGVRGPESPTLPVESPLESGAPLTIPAYPECERSERIEGAAWVVGASRESQVESSVTTTPRYARSARTRGMRGSGNAEDAEEAGYTLWADPRPPDPSTPNPQPPNPHPPLSAIRVVDFTWVVAGPLATRVLADFGAEVVHVARTDLVPAGGSSAANLRRGKRQMVLDLRRADDLATVRALLREADVVVDNFSRRVLPNFGLDDAALHALNPRLVIAHLAAFAADDPRADWVAFGPTLHALGGLTAAMCGPGGATAGPGFAYSDTASGWAMAVAIVAALWRGGGAVIDLAQHDVLAMMLAGATPAPGAIHRCADEEGRDRWCAIESADPRHATGVRERRAEDVVAALQAAGIAAAVVATPADLAADPQLLARGWWHRIDGVHMDGVVPRLVR